MSNKELNNIKDFIKLYCDKLYNRLYGSFENYLYYNFNRSNTSGNIENYCNDIIHLKILPLIIEIYHDAHWIWRILSELPNIPIDFIGKHPEYKWDWHLVSRRKDFIVDFISKYQHNAWDKFSSSPKITIEIIEKHIYKNWDWGQYGLSQNENLTEEFVEKYIDKPWDWGCLSRHPNITMGFVEKHINKPWNWGKWGLSKHPNLTMEFLEKHIDKPWDWSYCGLSRNPNLTEEFVKKHKNKDWHWEHVIGICNITEDFIRRNNIKLNNRHALLNSIVHRYDKYLSQKKKRESIIKYRKQIREKQDRGM
jgi:hypothetical protein